MKECTNCHLSKPVAEFYRLSAQKSGLNPWCKTCVNERNRAYHEANKERMLEWKRRAQLRRWAQQHLGLSQEQYGALLARAGGRCEVCGRAERSTSTNGHSFLLAIDHDHVTQQIRGMLCRQCNTALGCTQDDPALLRKLADYLENPIGLPVPSPLLDEQLTAHRARDTFGLSQRPATGWKQTTKARAKIAKSHIGIKSPYKGVPRTPEVRAKISAGLTGRVLSDEARANMRAARLRYLASQKA